jgi:uncharacterized delta-60 repeat protein
MYSFSEIKLLVSKTGLTYLAVLSLVLLSFAMATRAASGNLDRLFGDRGKAVPSSPTAQVLFDAVVQPDGKIVAAGMTYPADANFNFLAYRFNADGSLDTTFGTNGRVTVEVSNKTDGARSVALQSDGKIVLGGYYSDASQQSQFAVVRLNTDGSLDNAFGEQGIVRYVFAGNNGGIYNVAIQTVGGQERIIAAGYKQAGAADFATIRLLPSGQLDNTFGVQGVRVTGLTGTFGDNQRGLAIQQIDGQNKIVVSGYSLMNLGTSQRNDFVVIRYNEDGTPDTSFDTDGIVVTQMANDAMLNSVAIQQVDGQNKIVVAGKTYRSGHGIDFALARYNNDGSLDASFGEGGRAYVDFTGGDDEPKKVLVTPDNKIVATGFTSNNFVYLNKDFGAVRLNLGGTVDRSFASCGTITSHFGYSSEIAWGSVLQQDGKLIMVGETSNIATAVRYTTGGAASPTGKDFDGDGRTDVSVFRPSDGNWYINCSCQGERGTRFGQAGDIPVAADYDGDGKTDVAVFRSGTWLINRSSDGQMSVVSFGTTGDTPAVGDYDGDEKADASVWRASEGMWYVLRSSDGQWTGQAAGGAGDRPVAADYDNDGKTDIAIYHAGQWWVDPSSTPDHGYTVTAFGAASDTPLTGDYEGDGRDDLTVFRASEGMWYQQLSTAGYKGTRWGIEGDFPVPGDYDGDRKADIAVNRAGTWYILYSSTNTYSGVSWGLQTDILAVR